MIYNIRWTVKSADTFDDIIDFIRLTWNEKIVEKFVKETFSFLEMISKHPTLFKSIDDIQIRKGLINKHISVFYQINENEIDLLYFWDNRKNPKRRRRK